MLRHLGLRPCVYESEQLRKKGRLVGSLRDREHWVRSAPGFVRQARRIGFALYRKRGPASIEVPWRPAIATTRMPRFARQRDPCLQRDLGIENFEFDWCDRPGSAGVANWLRFVRQRGPASSVTPG